MLRTGTAYQERGDTYLDQLDKSRVASNLVRRLERLGYQVQLNTA